MNEKSLGLIFDKEETDRLIEAYGHKPEPVERQSLEEYLRGQRARFDEVECERVQARNGPDRDR